MRNIRRSQIVNVEGKKLCILKTDIEQSLYLAIELEGADNDAVYKIVEINDWNTEECDYIVYDFLKLENALEEFEVIRKEEN